MRKFYMLFIALFVSGFVSYASAQRFDISFDVNQKITNARHRFVKGVSLQPTILNTLNGTKQEITINEGIYYNSESENNLGNYNVYNNVTSQSFTIKAGQTVQPNFNMPSHWDGGWMHSYVYVDENLDGTLTVSNPAELKANTSGENETSSWVNHIGTFRAPTTPGTYPMRFKIDWNSNLPQGGSNIVTDGGCITDVDMVVSYPAITFDVNDDALGVVSGETENQVCGTTYTFTVTPIDGYTASVSATVGDGSVTQSYTPTNNGDGTYTISAAQFQNDMTISVTFTEKTYTVQDALNGSCYFRLKNASTNGYLKADVTPVTGGKIPSANSILVYNRDLENNKPLSFLWKLIDGKLTCQGYQINTFGSWDGIPVVDMSKSGAAVKFATSGSYYTIQTKNSFSRYKFLHAKSFGLTTGDGNYPQNNTAGNYVVTWNNTAEASKWTVEPVSSFELTIGTGGWSSFNCASDIGFFPSQVTNVYISTSENTGVVTLEPLETVNGLIRVPKNTPIFIEGEPGATCKVILLTSEPAAVSGNKLRGTTLPQTATLNANETAYVIATKDDKTALYKLGAGVKIPCNKAYYVSSQAQTAKLELNFGEVTEISNAVTAQPALKDEILYDLSGHRVVYPTRGIYVTGSGRKIFVK
ncbi:MAG: hypothetical protein MR641_05960 [Bacteroidales bacterium]|nr:hypothetical protein [Bacteroidales bacterium]